MSNTNNTELVYHQQPATWCASHHYQSAIDQKNDPALRALHTVFPMKRIVLVGDSDIAFWPKQLLPSPLNCAEEGGTEIDTTEWDQTLVSGHSGAKLAEVLPNLRTVLAESQACDDGGGGDIVGDGNRRTIRARSKSSDTLIVVACAGENDIGEGLSLGKSVEALREFLDMVFLSDDANSHSSYQNNGGDRFLLFLGPKFEPWLEDDPSYKKKYSAMTRAFQHCLQEYKIENSTTKNSTSNGYRINIHFVDCLTMFCGETANIPGARLCGRAKADPRYFASDQLHLSKEGYSMWKDVVETQIRQFLSASTSS